MTERRNDNENTGGSVRWKKCGRVSDGLVRLVVGLILFASVSDCAFVDGCVGGDAVEPSGCKSNDNDKDNDNDNVRFLQFGSIASSVTTSSNRRNEMRDCLNDAIFGRDRERKRSDDDDEGPDRERKRSEAAKSDFGFSPLMIPEDPDDLDPLRFGPGDVPSSYGYDEEILDWFYRCYDRLLLGDVEKFFVDDPPTTPTYQAPSLEVVCCGGVPVGTTRPAGPSTPRPAPTTSVPLSSLSPTEIRGIDTPSTGASAGPTAVPSTGASTGPTAVPPSSLLPSEGASRAPSPVPSSSSYPSSTPSGSAKTAKKKTQKKPKKKKNKKKKQGGRRRPRRPRRQERPEQDEGSSSSRQEEFERRRRRRQKTRRQGDHVEDPTQSQLLLVRALKLVDHTVDDIITDLCLPAYEGGHCSQLQQRPVPTEPPRRTIPL